MSEKNYTSLHNHDTFSVLDGMYRPDVYIKKAKEMGMTAYAQTNHGSMSGFFEFYDACKEHEVKPIFGVEAYFVDDKTIKDKEHRKSKHIILLAKNKKGYLALLKLQFYAVKDGFYYRPRIDWKDLELLQGDVIVSSACINGMIAHYVSAALQAEKREDKHTHMQEATKVAKKLKKMFKDDFYFEYNALKRTKVYGPVWSKMHDLAKDLKIKSIITLDTHYLEDGDAELQDIIHLVRDKLTMKDKEAGKGWTYDDRDLYLKSYDEVMEIMHEIFSKKIVEECLENTNDIANKVEEYEIYPKGYVFPKTEFDESKLKELIKKGLDEKISFKKRGKYLKRLNYEYKIIREMGFLEYFWIVQDIVNWAKHNEIEVGVARGSAAGCLISYLLNITELDPIRFSLSFERFLNPTRKKMPDIDIDFQKARRPEVLVYAKKYGENNVSQIPNYVSLTVKSAMKDVMKVYGVSFQESNEFTSNWDGITPVPKEYQEYYKKAKKLERNIRNYSKHAAGIIITDKPIYKYLPTISLAKNINVGIDGKTLVSKGFLKIDILGIKALDIIHDAIKYIKKYEDKDVDILNIDIHDENVLDVFKNGDTTNIFQFETWNFKQLLQELQPTHFRHLIEANALNRPTPLSLGYHEEYIKRKMGETYSTPKLLKPHLKTTFGLLIYQEQTNSILADWLDLSDGEADALRRDIEKIGFEEVMEEHIPKLYKKYDKEDVEDAVNEIKKVVGYAFNKSHSTSYAYIAFQMGHLKYYYRKYFNLACLNAESKAERLQKIIDDCFSHGIDIKTFNLNEITLNFDIDKDGLMIPGAKILDGLGEKSLEALVKNKPYKDFDDFMNRAKTTTPKGNERRVSIRILKVLYEEGFFENAFGNTENDKVKLLLDKEEEKKTKKLEKKEKKENEKKES